MLEGVSAPTKTGYDFEGWKCGDVVVSEATTYAELAENDSVGSISLTAQWTAKSYTVRFEGADMADKTTGWSGKVLEGVSAPTKTGFDFAGWKCGDVAVSAATTYADLAENDSVDSITLTAQWEDNEPPIGTIQVDTNRWNNFLNKITFNLFFRNTQRVEITASDTSGETVKIEYLLTDTEMTQNALAGEAFTEYTGPFSIDPDREYIIYARLTDGGSNVSYISSDGMVLDATAPGIMGIEDGATYCQAQTVTIDEKYVNLVTVNGQEVKLDGNGQFILAPAEGPQQITVTDQAKNSTSMTVTVHDGHTAAADDGNCATPVYCVYHSDVVVIAAKQHDFSGDWHRDDSHHWHVCQNSGCTVADAPADHSGSDDGDCTTAVVCACGYVLTEAQAGHTWGAWSSDGNGTHTRRCTADGCTQGVETESCSGGTATCHSKAVCDVCGGEYGEIDPDHHDGGTEIRGQTAASCTQAGYSGDTCCRGCGAVLTQGAEIPATGHSGGTATCHSKAICDACGDEYGEIDPDNHEGGTEIRGQAAASCTDAGYSGDICCRGCGAVLTQGAEIPATGHSGGTATCHSKAVCDACGSEYGEIDPDNHDGGTEIRGQAAASCTQAGYSGDTCCRGCGAVLAQGSEIPATGHSGGTATCHSKAVCDACGSEYGEIDPDYHEELRHFPSKAATTDAEGHVEYWYCVDCRRYYTDAEATKEVTGADIVTAKLPGDQPTPPTGDSSSFPLWVAALFISGGLTIGAAVIGRAGIRRSKRNKE